MLRALISSLAFAVLLDRVIVSVGLDAITESQLKEELAVTAFLNHVPVPTSLDERRAAAHRLVQQTLILREMRLAHFPSIDPSQVQQSAGRVIAGYGGSRPYESALQRYGVTATTVNQHIATQLATLRFIEYRFRPGAGISDDELRSEYNRRTANWETDHPGVSKPDFDGSRKELRSDLVERRTDEALDNWLQQTTSQTRVVYLDISLRPQH